jgi:hypothetical protein
MKKSRYTVTNVLGIAALVLVGYAVVASIPDFVRYVRISTM